MRLTLGNRDIKNNTIEIARRDTLEKQVYSIDKIEEKIESMLDSIQENLFEKAKNFNKKNTFIVNTKDEFKKAIRKEVSFMLIGMEVEKLKKKLKMKLRLQLDVYH